MVRQDLEKHSGYLSLDIGSSDFCRSPSSGRMSKIVMGVCFFNPSLSLVEGIASEIYPSYSVPVLEAFHLDPYALSILRILQSSHSPCRFRDRSLGCFWTAPARLLLLVSRLSLSAERRTFYTVLPSPCYRLY